MKVLLVYPYFLDDRIDAEDIRAVPMGLYYIGAALRANGYTAAIFNAHDLKNAPDRIRAVLRETRPDVVGFSILNANRWGGIDIARMIKRMRPATITVFGGVGATFLWRHLLTHFPEIDYVVRGEGEHTFLELLRHFAHRPAKDPGRIAGIAFRKAGVPVKTRDRDPVADLDSLPMPAEVFAFPHLSLTRGCPSGCTFCGSPAIWKRRVRFHGADYFVGQMARLKEKGVTFFHVSDDTFTLDRDRVIAVCRQLIGRRIDAVWTAISRVDAVDAEMLGWMRRAGCCQISYGVESGSRAIRDRFHKSISDDAIRRAFDLTVRYGILARAYFIYGAPGESDATIAASLALMRRIRPLAAIFYMLDLFPGTALYADYKRRCGVSDDVWLQRVEDIPYFETDDRLNRESVLRFGKRLRQGFFSRLPAFARQVELVDDPDYAPLHADFLSRLALTFSHGDYAANPLIPDKRETAIALFKRSLTYHPDHRAFWGLGMTYRQAGRPEASVRLLQAGIVHHPDSFDLHLSLAESLMQLQRYPAARRCLSAFKRHPRAIDALIRCHRRMGDRDGERAWIAKARETRQINGKG